MIRFVYFVLLTGVMVSLSSADDSPTNSPSVTKVGEIKSDYPSIVPPVWPESTSPPSPVPLCDDDVFETYSSVQPLMADQPSSFPSDSPISVSLDNPIKSDYPSIVPPLWPENTSPPSPGPLHDDDAFETYSVVPYWSAYPSLAPSTVPSAFPSDQSSSVPSDYPSSVPSDYPSSVPSDYPSSVPSDFPSSIPSDYPSVVPSSDPSTVPTSYPSYNSSSAPSVSPGDVPSVILKALDGFVIADTPEHAVTQASAVEEGIISGKGKNSKKTRRAASKEPKKSRKNMGLLRKRMK